MLHHLKVTDLSHAFEAAGLCSLNQIFFVTLLLNNQIICHYNRQSHILSYAELRSLDTRVGKFLPVRGKKRFFSMEKTVPAKIVFAGWKKPPGKNPAKLALQTFTRWKKVDF
jgi:hypothetical protein